MTEKSSELSIQKAAAIREKILLASHRAKTPHIGSCLSLVDMLAVLYFGVLRRPAVDSPDFARRDRLVLSKGHGGLALYATLVERGLLPAEYLENYAKDDTIFPAHPVRCVEFGIEATAGSLGHGFPMAVGMALSAQRAKQTQRVFAVISDGECDEGSTWEAVLAAAQWRLDNLVVLVDYNKIQSFGRVSEVMELEPFASKWESFRWAVKEVNGHDHAALADALSQVPFRAGQPSVLIAHTVKGKGVSFMENTVDWHYKNLTDELLAEALREIRTA